MTHFGKAHFGFQPRNTPAERRAFFDLIRQKADTDDVIETILESVTALEDTAWQTPTLLNSWVDFGSDHPVARWREWNGRLQIVGMIKNGTTTGGTDIMDLPVTLSHRPIFPVVVNDVFGSIEITTAGQVRCRNIPNNVFVSINVDHPLAVA